MSELKEDSFHSLTLTLDNGAGFIRLHTNANLLEASEKDLTYLKKLFRLVREHQQKKDAIATGGSSLALDAEPKWRKATLEEYERGECQPCPEHEGEQCGLCKGCGFVVPDGVRRVRCDI